MIGGVLLLWKQEFARRFSLFLISFAAGVLLGVAFFDLLPEALLGLKDIRILSFLALSAIVFLFTIERTLWWYHHHRMNTKEHPREQSLHQAQAYLLLGGDTIHNFVDGVVIAAAFLTDFSLGVGVALAVIAHELPQEIADFSIMLDAGFRRLKVFLLNLAAASATVVGAIIAFFAFSAVSALIPYILAVAFGVFIYIALSDLIPSIHHRSEHKYDILHFVFLAGGIVLILFL